MNKSISMDQLENVDAFTALVDRFNCRQPPIDKQRANMARDENTIITARIRPLLPEEIENRQVEGTLSRTGTMIDAHVMTLGLPGGPKLRSSEFYLDRVYGPNTSTEHLYDQLTAPLVELALMGGTGTLFAYGQTGSGKTFTVSGLEKIVAKDLFHNRNVATRTIAVSIFELGNSLNSGCDLLNDRKPVQILEDSLGETRIVGAIQPNVDSADKLIALIDKASQFRKTQATEKNEFSSRSHAICRISITEPAMPAAAEGILYLVDLAGSEAARDMAHHSSDRMKETREINNSLSVLKDCIRGRAQFNLSSGKKPYVPYRQSVLSKTLKHLFDPAAGRLCKMSVVACINPSFLDVGPSRNTLRYAEMLRVPVPTSQPLLSDPEIPSTWTNEEVKKWMVENSGDLHINADHVAPYHTGIQLIKMADMEFVQRCMKTPHITKEQAAAFRSKLWQLHVDSQRPAKKKTNSSAYDPHKSSSQVPPEKATIPFKQRLRPGMVVKYKSTKPRAVKSMGMILCPDWAVETEVVDVNKEIVRGTRNGDGKRRYLCSLVLPGVMQGSYHLDAWRQEVVYVEDMEAEVILEFDPATRFYFLAV